MLEHDELDALLNGVDRDQPLSPLDLSLPTDPDLITLLSSSSPISPVALPNQQPNPLVDEFLQSLTNIPIQFTDHPANSRQESRVNILLPSLCGSTAQSTKTQSEESQSNPSSPRRLLSNSTALGTSTQDARASLFRPNRFQRNQQFFLNRSKGKAVIGLTNLSEDIDTTPVYTTSLLTHFLLGKLCFGIIKDWNIPSRTLLYHHRDSWYPSQLSKYSPSNDTESTSAHIQAD